MSLDEEFKWLKMDRNVFIVGPHSCAHCGRTQTAPADEVYQTVVVMVWHGLDTGGQKRTFRVERVLGEKLDLFKATALKNEADDEPMPENPTDDAVEITEKQEDKK